MKLDGATELDAPTDRLLLLRSPLFIAFVAFVMRMIHIAAPYANLDAWKQSFVFGYARALARGGSLQIGVPERVAPFPNTSVEEALVYTSVVGLGMYLFGEYTFVPRLLSIVASILGLFAMHAWVERRRGGNIAALAAWFYAFIPASWFYGSAIQPEAFMLGFALVALARHARADGTVGSDRARVGGVFRACAAGDERPRRLVLSAAVCGGRRVDRARCDAHRRVGDERR